MTSRERFLETLLFGNPDRIPLSPGYGRQSTRERWYREGLPRDTEDIVEYAYRKAGGKLDLPSGGEGFQVNERMIPQFEEKIIEKKENSQIVQDWKGNICEIGSEFTVEHLRNAIDFVTRRWIRCPVENHADWEDMRKRYDPEDASRLEPDAEAAGRRLKNREHAIWFHFSGPYWQLREWLGFEGLSMMFYDDPAFVEEMIKFWEEYITALMKRAFKYCIPDMVHISEDMAYKGYSMLSPQMTEKFLLPVWSRWGTMIKEAGVPVYAVDSDGYIGELIPIWIDAGFNVCEPMEVAAGNDIVGYRRRFGKKMAFLGGVDKREMAKGGKSIENEMKRIAPVINDGGYIPGCDHGIPSDVSWEDFLYYVKLLAESTGWL